MDVINTTQMEIAYIMGKITPPGHSMTLIVKGTFDLENGGSVKLAEEQLPPTGDMFYPEDEDMTGAPQYASDFAYFKPRADLLLAGHCHAPKGTQRAAGEVIFQVGSMKKSLLVMGDRVWKWGLFGSSPSDPEPFSSLELRYDNSYGGLGYEKNPVGKGYGKVSLNGGRKKRLVPNIVQVDDHLSSPYTKLDPAGFGPLAITWPQRRSKLGTYKGDWLKKRWPFFPSDFDWGFFNAAPPDMQMQGYLNGDESLYLENLHPVHQSYRSKLPELRIRSFVSLPPTDGGDTDLFKEVLMNLDTLWVDSSNEKLVLVWRGWTQVQSDDPDQINYLYTAVESLGEKPESASAHEKQLKTIVKAEDEEFEPEPIEAAAAENDQKIDIDAENAKAEKEFREALKAQGIDPDEPPPPLSDKAKKEEARILKDYGITLPSPPEAKINRDHFILLLNQKKSFKGADLRGLDLGDLEMGAVDLSESLLSDTVLTGSKLVNANLKGANLSNADLSRSDLSEADLSDADLTGANLKHAILTKAILTDSIITGADLEKADLTGAVAKSADFSKANLKHAVFLKAELSDAEFSKADLSFSDFTYAVLTEASIRGAKGTGMCMDKADLTELRASEGCVFEKCSFKMVMAKDSIWTGSVFTESNFSFGDFKEADFSKATLDKAIFNAAECSASRFGNASMKEALFVKANLFEANLEKTDLYHCNFSGANLYGAEFLDAVMNQTMIEGANLKMTKLYKE